MTIISRKDVHRNSLWGSDSSSNNEPGTPNLWKVAEAPFQGYDDRPIEGYKQSTSRNGIIIDNGMTSLPILYDPSSLMKRRCQYFSGWLVVRLETEHILSTNCGSLSRPQIQSSSLVRWV